MINCIVYWLQIDNARLSITIFPPGAQGIDSAENSPDKIASPAKTESINGADCAKGIYSGEETNMLCNHCGAENVEAVRSDSVCVVFRCEACKSVSTLFRYALPAHKIAGEINRINTWLQSEFPENAVLHGIEVTEI